ncbi:MAG: hypothetical protein GOU97_02120 [Nanoarchaeota archaeon]|nr:hypothetical protein [Nanoarchaeota archaeon]
MGFFGRRKLNKFNQMGLIPAGNVPEKEFFEQAEKRLRMTKTLRELLELTKTHDIDLNDLFKRVGFDYLQKKIPVKKSEDFEIIKRKEQILPLGVKRPVFNEFILRDRIINRPEQRCFGKFFTGLDLIAYEETGWREHGEIKKNRIVLHENIHAIRTNFIEPAEYMPDVLQFPEIVWGGAEAIDIYEKNRWDEEEKGGQKFSTPSFFDVACSYMIIRDSSPDLNVSAMAVRMTAEEICYASRKAVSDDHYHAGFFMGFGKLTGRIEQTLDQTIIEMRDEELMPEYRARMILDAGRMK